MSFIESVRPSLTTMTSKSGASRSATCTARITRLAMVPPSLYAGKNMLSPAGRVGRGCDMKRFILGLFWPRREAPRHDGRLDDDRSRQLRCALPPLDECDWHLSASKPRPRSFPCELDDECVAVGADRGERQPLEHFAAPAAKAARAVADRQPRDHTDVSIGECAEHPPVERPVLDAPARNVS